MKELLKVSELLQKRQLLENEYIEYENQQNMIGHVNYGKVYIVIAWAGYIILFIWFMASLIGHFKNNWGVFHNVGFFIRYFIIPLIPIFIFYTVVYFIYSKLILRIVDTILSFISGFIQGWRSLNEKHKIIIQGMEEKRNTIVEQIQEIDYFLAQSTIPQEYHNLNIIQTLIKLLETGRANSLGDAYNIYEFQIQRVKDQQYIQQLEDNLNKSEGKLQYFQNELRKLNTEIKRKDKEVKKAKSKAEWERLRKILK